MADFTDTYSDAYEDFGSYNVSLQQTEAINDLNEQLASESVSAGLPACHLNFSNLGNLNFPWLNYTKTPINYKLFNKLQKLSITIRRINDALISMIEKFKCCDIADLYNDTVLPIFEWVLEKFINILV